MDKRRYILAGRLIDGSGAPVRRNILLEIQDGIIISCQPATAFPGDAVGDDLSHCTLVPALVDCTVALLQSPSVGERSLSLAENRIEEQGDIPKDMLGRHIQYCFAHGVLGVVAQDKSGLVQECQRRSEQADGIVLRTAHAGADADFLRISYSADIEEAASVSLQLDHDHLCRILSKRGEKKAIVVANGPQQVAQALEAGCDALEQGYGMGETNLIRMAAEDVLWIPNVVRAKNALDASSSGGSVCCRFSTRYVAPGEPVPGAEAFWKKVLADQLAQLRLARELGVQIAVGTGAGSIGILHGESVVEEIKLLLKAGFSLEESIQCASTNGAAFFGMEELGQLGVGQRATFLLTRGTVGQLPRKLSYLEGVYIDGMPSAAYSK